MPPKMRMQDSDEDSSESSDVTTDEESTSSGSDDSSDDSSSDEGQFDIQGSGVPSQQSGQHISNNPHDEVYEAGGSGYDAATPRDAPAGGAGPVTTAPPAVAPTGGHQLLQNNPDDESYAVTDDRHVSTPPEGAQRQESFNNKGGGGGGEAAPQKKPSELRAGLLANDSHDEFEDVEDDMSSEDDETPVKAPPQQSLHQPPPQQQQFGSQGGFNTSGVVRDMPHDEEVNVSSSQSHVTASPSASSAAQSPPSAKKQQLSSMQPESDESSEDESSSEDDTDGAPRMGQTSEAPAAGPAEYNPADWAYLNNKVSREVRDLFMHISQYQPTVQELPSKLKPFVPDYLPAVGDIDAFCKVPRPDGEADNFGLTVVDEPCVPQSNPLVVKISLQYQGKEKTESSFVDSVADAQNRPQVVDQWITDVKKLHTEKPNPTVNYSKMMPDIESLLQIWPEEFENILNSDAQFPPSNIDLDIEQYVRVMCAILDIPCYTNMIESLHVMFTLYLEFRANQHFQHA